MRAIAALGTHKDHICTYVHDYKQAGPFVVKHIQCAKGPEGKLPWRASLRRADITSYPSFPQKRGRERLTRRFALPSIPPSTGAGGTLPHSLV